MPGVLRRGEPRQASCSIHRRDGARSPSVAGAFRAEEGYGYRSFRFLDGLEQRSHLYVLGFAASCLAASLNAVLIHAWPFAAVEVVWAVVALRRWVRVRPRAAGQSHA